MTFLYTVPPILLLGFLSGWGSNSGDRNPWFRALRKPPFMPPGWLFPVAWSLLYVAMGVSLGRVVDTAGPGRPLALALFGLQLLLNLLWSPVFFRWRRPDWALAVIGTLDAAALATAVAFWPIDRPAALLFLPYLGWLALATALNRAILALNPGLLAKAADRPT